MSILIPDMEMPKNCLACPLVSGFMLWVEGRTPPTIDTRLCRIRREMKYIPGEEKPDWCPLIELPPHGRLIDADQLLSIWEKDRQSIHEHGVEYCEESYDDVIDSFAWDVKNIRTIIEAEDTDA